DVVRPDEPDVFAVVLVLDVARRERRVLLGHHAVGERAVWDGDRFGQARDVGLILGLAGAVLLAVAVPDLRARLHDHAGQRAVLARVPGASRADGGAGVGFGVFAEVPDVTGGILRVVVVRVLQEIAGRALQEI